MKSNKEEKNKKGERRMEYRKLGKTGYSVSEIGMGCEGFVEKPYEQILEFVDLMEEEGVNCIDLYAPNPRMRSDLGKALAGRRDRFVLQAHLCTIWKEEQYKRTRLPEEVKAGFEDQLTRLGTDHVEIGMIHYVDSLEDWKQVAEGPVMRYAQEQKRAGAIGCIGLSSHNPQAALAAVESGLVDVLMFSVNPCYDLLPASEDVEKLWSAESYAGRLLNMDPERSSLYETCERLGVGITVMKAFGGGDLLQSTLSPAGKALTPFQCLSYALARPAVASVLVGARSTEELRASIAYEHASKEEKDYGAALAALPKVSWQGHCMYCGHCAPCPKGIDVASVTRFLNLATAQQEVPETVREHYGLLSHKADVCIGCGVCETRCPFGVPVMENMKKAAALFPGS